MSDQPVASPDDEPRYRIGAVGQLTGLSQHVLRVWEKRYAVVQPSRGNNRRRLYSDRDVRKLMLLKSLVDRGHAIGSIARLDTAELEHRLQQSSGLQQPAIPEKRPRLYLFGSFPGLSTDSRMFELAGRCADHERFVPSSEDRGLDIAVVEWPVLQTDAAVAVARLANRLNTRHLIVVYDYAPQSALDSLRGTRLTALRSPLDLAALEAVVGWRFGIGDPGIEDDPNPGTLAPPRRFTDRELAFIATQSAAVACECPRHLSQLISRLARFEAYSAECESRGADDAALHEYLYRTTSRARRQFEEALARVMEMENLASSPGP